MFFFINRKPELERVSVLKLYEMYSRNELDLFPYYQRYSDLWSPEKKRLLIDTIINGYDIPKFYFHYIQSNQDPLNKSEKKYAIIDGKQRINTLIEFINNEFELDETVKCLENTELSFKKIKYEDLFENKYFNIKTKIDNFILDIIHISTDEYEMISEMFLRLNNGVGVNNAEKRNAIGGFLIEAINEIVKQNDFFRNKVGFSNKRMEHQDLIIKLSLIETTTVESLDNVESFTKTKLDNLVKKFKPKKNDSPQEKKILKNEVEVLLKKVVDSLNLMNSFFNPKDELLRYKGAVPLYYLFLKKNNSINKKKFRDFITTFENIRTENRKINKRADANATLLQFDRLNQQGAYGAKSLLTRLKIIDFYWNNRNFKEVLNDKDIDLRDEEQESFS